MAPADTAKKPQLKVTGQKRVQVLYEEYVHLRQLKQVWDSPVSDKPALEPLFTAGFHGIELAFLMLATFIQDGRGYVAKRPRIEAVADDIRAQCQLLGELVDGELEVEGVPCRVSLTQDFPFEGCPPTTSSPGHSPGLARLVAAVEAAAERATPAERNSLIKVALNIAHAFTSAFSRWTVGLGIEGQLVALVAAATGSEGALTPPGASSPEPSYAPPSSKVLPPIAARATSASQLDVAGLPLAASQCVGLLWRARRPGARYLDYNALVRPGVVEATLTGEVYENAEDFFFRTVHLGTECWMFAANALAASAAEHAAKGAWHVAAARTALVTRVLHYLGDHILTLTRMNLRDYLQLKVQLEGTSGAGSSQVRAIKPLVLSLLGPLRAQALALAHKRHLHLPGSKDTGGMASSSASSAGEDSEGGQGPDGSVAEGLGAGVEEGEEDAAILAGVMYIYAHPDQYAGLYNYAKALEDVESGLLGGFYYKHYLLATNVIGSAARGTMRRAVGALKAGYEKPLFPVLDAARCALGARFDAELAHMRGKMMDDIIERYLAESAGHAQPPSGASATPQTASAPLAAALGAALGAAAAAAAAAPVSSDDTAAGSDQANAGPHSSTPPATALGAAAVVALGAAVATASQRPGQHQDSSLAQQDSAQPDGLPSRGASPSSLATPGSRACPFLLPTAPAPTTITSDIHAAPYAAHPPVAPAARERGPRSGCPFLSGTPCTNTVSSAGPSPAHSLEFSGALPASESLRAEQGAVGGQGCPFGHGAGNGHVEAPARSPPVTNLASRLGLVGQRIDVGQGQGLGGQVVSSAGCKEEQEKQEEEGDDEEDAELMAVEAVRSHLYSWEAVPQSFVEMERDATREAHAQLYELRRGSGSSNGAAAPPTLPLAFLSHAWGTTPPRVKAASLRRLTGLYALGNSAWDVVFGALLPEAGDHVLQLLGVPPAAPVGTDDKSSVGSADSAPMPQPQPLARVHWGGNSHELVWRVASSFMERPADDPPMRVLTSDTEFYSLTRQLNRLSQQRHDKSSSSNAAAHRFALGVEVECVAAEPTNTFTQRLLQAASAQRYDLVYVSQITYLTQKALVPDVGALVQGLSDVLASQQPGSSAAALTGDERLQQGTAAAADDMPGPPRPLILIDGYHGFGAVPTYLGDAFRAPAVLSGRVGLGYVSGLLKHLGCGPGAAFMVLSSSWRVRPLFTGWLADPSVLAPGGTGIGPGSPVGYFPPLALQGATPSYLTPLLTFLELMAAWGRGGSCNGTGGRGRHGSSAGGGAVTVQGVHAHVVALQQRFLRRWPAVLEANIGLLGSCRLVNVSQDPVHQSHTLVLECTDAQQAARVAAAVEACGVLVDTRKCFVRLGFGFYHSRQDVDALLRALEAAR